MPNNLVCPIGHQGSYNWINLLICAQILTSWQQTPMIIQRTKRAVSSLRRSKYNNAFYALELSMPVTSTGLGSGTTTVSLVIWFMVAPVLFWDVARRFSLPAVAIPLRSHLGRVQHFEQGRMLAANHSRWRGQRHLVLVNWKGWDNAISKSLETVQQTWTLDVFEAEWDDHRPMFQVKFCAVAA